MKLHQFIYFIFFLVSTSTSVLSMDDDEVNGVRNTLSALATSADSIENLDDSPKVTSLVASGGLSPDSILPMEIWGLIAYFVAHEHLANYLLSCKGIYNVCMTDKAFFEIPEEKDIDKVVASASFGQLQMLAMKWGRVKRLSTISLLQSRVNDYSGHTYTYPYEYARPVPELEYNSAMHTFCMDTKYKYLLYLLGAEKSEEALKQLKEDKLQQFMDEVEGQENYPLVLQWKWMQVVVCHKDAYGYLCGNNSDENCVLSEEQQKEAAKRRRYFSPFLEVISKTKAPIEGILDIFS